MIRCRKLCRSAAQRAGGEDRLLTAKNKWLIGHPEGGLPEGTHLGLVGENICVNDLER